MRTATQLLAMNGRRVLITGAAAGIGKALALRFADAGADLVLVDRDEAGLSQLVNDLCRFGINVTTHVVDLTHKTAIDALWEHLESALPDTLINNAGSYPLRDYLEVEAHFLEQVLQLNLEATLWMCQRFIARRKDGGGVIVNVSSIEAVVPLRDDLIPYSVSKAGILALTRSLAHAYGRRGFRVNVVIPGAIQTPGTQRLKQQVIRHLNVDLIKTGYLFGTRLALGRWGEADEVARVVLFLASDLASYVQGAAIPVDGGFLAS